MRAKRVVAAAVTIEVVTACLLIFAPAVFARLLLGAELTGAGATIGQLAGISLVALALACWPRGPSPGQAAQPLLALLVFSVLCALLLVYIGISGASAGLLLWPAAAAHAAIAGLLSWSSLVERRRQTAT